MPHRRQSMLLGGTPLDPSVYVKSTSSGRVIVLALYVGNTAVVCHLKDEAVWLVDKRVIVKC